MTVTGIQSWWRDSEVVDWTLY